MTKQITLEVEAPIAEAYQNATPEHRQALQAIVSLNLYLFHLKKNLYSIKRF